MVRSDQLVVDVRPPKSPLHPEALSCNHWSVPMSALIRASGAEINRSHGPPDQDVPGSYEMLVGGHLHFPPIVLAPWWDPCAPGAQNVFSARGACVLFCVRS